MIPNILKNVLTTVKNRGVFFYIYLFLSCIVNGQIVADHTIVVDYASIPQTYIDEVKKMWLVVPGESHSKAYREGLELLEELDSRFAVNVKESGTPESYTDQYLRTSRATWGDVNNETGWVYNYGEEDWCCFVNYPTYTYNPVAVGRTKDGIAYCNDHNLTIGALGFAHCYDDGKNLAYSYLQATEEYIKFCDSSDINTQIFFTTGPVDGYMASGSSGYQQYLKWQLVRDSVEGHSTWFLFDYADILSYDDNGVLSTATYDGHTFPVITDLNQGDAGVGHIGKPGAIRLAKALWWMLARMKGWDGKIVTKVDNYSSDFLNYVLNFINGQLIVRTNNSGDFDHLRLFDVQGQMVHDYSIKNQQIFSVDADLDNGLYFAVLSGRQGVRVSKLLVK